MEKMFNYFLYTSFMLLAVGITCSFFSASLLPTIFVIFFIYCFSKFINFFDEHEK